VSAADVAPWIQPPIVIPRNIRDSLSIAAAERAKHHDRGDYGSHETGVFGEWGLLRALGIEDQADNITEIYEYGDGGNDFQIGRQKIDVKTARPCWQRPMLLVDANKPITADCYVLAQQVGGARVQLIGYATARDIRERARMMDVSGALNTHVEKARVLDQSELRPLPWTRMMQIP
jgi:hypothetical protein